MDRIQAKEKITKLLRLANDKGATSSERDTALEMANKLASKYGFKIQKGTPCSGYAKNPTTLNKNTYIFDLNCFNKKFVNFLFAGLGIKDYFRTGKKTVSFDDYRNFNVDEFKKFYKKFVSVYYKLKKESNLGESTFFSIFTYDFMTGANRFDEEETHFIKAYMLGREFQMTKFF